MSKVTKMRNEDKLVKKALEVGSKLAKMQGFELPQHSQPTLAKAVYLFLVEAKQITPLPADKLDGVNIKKRLAIWIHNALPDGDTLK